MFSCDFPTVPSAQAQMPYFIKMPGNEIIGTQLKTAPIIF